MLNTIIYTASEARSKLYSLIKQASKGLKTFEIKLRGSDPVILMSKEELEGWMETLDIMSNPEEVKAIEKAKREKKEIPLEKILKEFGMENES